MFSTRPPAAGLRTAQRRDTECGHRGGFELAIVNIGEDPPLGRLGGFDAGLRLNNAGAGSFDGGAGGGDWAFADSSAARALCGRAIVIQLLGGDGSTLGEGVGANMAFRRGIQLRGAASLPLRWHAFHFVADRARLWRRDRAFRFLDLRGGFKTLLVQYRVSILASTSPRCTN